MEIFSMEFMYALGAIVLIDLVLAGDNAIVIALAARKLPRHLQTSAIAWGTVGAIAVRTVMTVVVVWLLKIPGLLLLGGALLLWIAVRLLAPEDEQGANQHGGATGFWGAMKTIVIADAVMGLDNVLAVAGAAQGSFLLVVLGLLISIPIVVWGSTLILKWVERFPVIVYAGAAVLAWTAVKMMLAEPMVKGFVEPVEAYAWLAHVAIISGVLAIGYALNRRVRSSAVAAKPMLALPAATAGAQAAEVADVAPVVRRVLFPVNGGAASRVAADHLVRSASRDGHVHVHVLHVTPSIHRHIGRFLSTRSMKSFAESRAAAAWAPVLRSLELAGIPTSTHVATSRDVAQAIVASAAGLGCERIVMGASRKSALVQSVTRSVAGRVLAGATMPVEVISGREAPLWQRVGVPAGVCVALGALLLELD